jgi:inner membrane protein
MAGLGHIAVGLAAGRLCSARAPRLATFAAMLWYSFLALLPDVDVVGFRLRVPYEAPFGHRGALHSIPIAIAVGVAVAVSQMARRRAWAVPALVATGVVASHGILDALTDGGLGVALFWPFTDSRSFLPWRPIPVSPIGRNVLTLRGLVVATTELSMFAPLFAFALWPRRKMLAPQVSEEGS